MIWAREKRWFRSTSIVLGTGGASAAAAGEAASHASAAGGHGGGHRSNKHIDDDDLPKRISALSRYSACTIPFIDDLL